MCLSFSASLIMSISSTVKVTSAWVRSTRSPCQDASPEGSAAAVPAPDSPGSHPDEVDGGWRSVLRGGRADETDYLRLDRYYTELIVEEGSAWVGKPLADFQAHMEGRLSIVDWLRDDVPQRGAACSRRRRPSA